MNFINNSEMAALVSEGMAETEVTVSTSNDVTTTTIYAGAPFRRTVRNGENTSTQEVWKIRRTIVVEDGGTTTITSKWAEGSWTNRASLTYKYL